MNGLRSCNLSAWVKQGPSVSADAGRMTCLYIEE